MAQYDIAAATKRISPVQEMMQYGLQQDARKINALNIEKAEIQMPYVEQLTQQQVRRGELGIEEAETRMPYLERQLAQNEELADLQISAAQDAERTRQRKARFQERLSQTLKAGQHPSVLREAYPMEYLEYMGLQNKQFADSMDSMRFHLSMVDSLPEGQRAEYWRKNLSSGAPQGFGEYSPETLATLRRNLDQGRNSMMSQLIDDYEWYKGRDPAMAQRILDYMDRMGRGGLGSTKSEREINALWGWTEKYGLSPTAVATRFDEINEQIIKDRRAFFKERLAASPQERLLFDTMTLDEIKAMKGEEAFEAALIGAHTDAILGLSKEDQEWYAWAKKGRDAATIPAATRPDVGSPPEEPEAAPRKSAQMPTPNAEGFYDFSGMSEAEAAPLINQLYKDNPSAKFIGPDGKKYGGKEGTAKNALEGWDEAAAGKNERASWVNPAMPTKEELAASPGGKVANWLTTPSEGLLSGVQKKYDAVRK